MHLNKKKKSVKNRKKVLKHSSMEKQKIGSRLNINNTINHMKVFVTILHFLQFNL